MILGPLEMAKCIGGSSECSIFEKCNIKSPVNKINLKVRKLYQDMNLAEILSNQVEEQNV